jgi:hypothetical protein
VPKLKLNKNVEIDVFELEIYLEAAEDFKEQRFCSSEIIFTQEKFR